VQLGDLITAQEVRQVKGGEFSKRDGFGQIAQVYNGQASCAPDSVVTPDGVQVLTRDAATDHVFARSITNTLNQDQGHADRFVPYVRTRFPAVGTNEQAAPMAKQAGNYVVRLIDEGHFVVSQLNPATSAGGQQSHTRRGNHNSGDGEHLCEYDFQRRQQPRSRASPLSTIRFSMLATCG